MANLLTTDTRPSNVTVGVDGIPNYLSTDKADPRRWSPPVGYTLRVFNGDRELHFVVEADRDRGWARTLPYDETPGGAQLQDKDGVTRLYHGLISFRIERIRVMPPRVTPNATRH